MKRPEYNEHSKEVSHSTEMGVGIYKFIKDICKGTVGEVLEICPKNIDYSEYTQFLDTYLSKNTPLFLRDSFNLDAQKILLGQDGMDESQFRFQLVQIVIDKLKGRLVILGQAFEYNEKGILIKVQAKDIPEKNRAEYFSILGSIDALSQETVF